MFRRSDDFNLLLATDGYKVTHWKQYPPRTENVYSYFESRGGRFPSTVFFGLQYYLKRYLEGAVVTAEKIDEAERYMARYFASALFNREGWEHILERHAGRLPVRIRAVPEGTEVPVSNVLMTIENTDPDCFWLPNFLETMLVQVWYPTTVCTLSLYIKRMLRLWLERTGDADDLELKFHDFGYRGVSSQETAALGGAAHLVNFHGTDTIAALTLLREYYGAETSGASIPAAEHSTITAWGREGELAAFANMLDSFPSGVVACVSDSFDIWAACRDLWGKALRERVLERDGVLVVRPDSGDPPTVVCKVLDILGEAFGFEINDKGFRVLNPHVRVIQGDGVSYEEAARVLEAMADRGWAATNVAFGSGGALLQKLNRDTQRFAFKCSSVVVNGERRDVFKDPVTDHDKRSKCGRLSLRRTGSGGVVTCPEGNAEADLLQEVFRNGRLLVNTTLEEVRVRATNADL